MFLFFAWAIASILPPSNAELEIHNAIVAQVKGSTISVIDLTRKMEPVFEEHFADLATSNEARYQFYMAGWRNAARELIDQQLILADAEEKEVAVFDGEVREAYEEKYGPHAMAKLEELGLSHEEAWKQVKNELVIQRMMGYFVYSKVYPQVTPAKVKKRYQKYIAENPSYEEWHFHTVSMKGPSQATLMIAAEKLAKQLHAKPVAIDQLTPLLKGIEKEFPGVTATLSDLQQYKDIDLADQHRVVLSRLSLGEYSAPLIQQSRASLGRDIARIFCLHKREGHPAPTFEEIGVKIRNQIFSEQIAKESEKYLKRLRSRYSVEGDLSLPSDFTPFSLR